MSSNIVSALLAGGFLLLGTVAGFLLNNWQRGRALAEQRDYDESLRRRELALSDLEKYHPVSEADARVVGKMLDSGGQVLNRNMHLNNLAYIREPIGYFYGPRAGCFPRGTLIMMEDGSFLPIETLHKGNSIRIYEIYTHTEANRAISDVRTTPKQQLIIINKEIAVTPEQELLCDGMYQSAIRLQLGATLASDDRHGVEVTSIEVVTTDEEVYCIALDEDAGYYIRSPRAERAVLVREATNGKQSLASVESEIIGQDSD